MSRFDAEDLLSGVLKLMTTNLNAKLAEIEAEKISRGAPSTGLKPVDATIGPDGTPNGYFEQTWSDKILNVDPAIFYGVEEITAQGMGPATSETYKIFCEIVLVDSGMDNLTSKRIHRYSRALKEIFEENWDKLYSSSKIKIETVRPISFKLDLNTSENIKVGGISLTTSLA